MEAGAKMNLSPALVILVVVSSGRSGGRGQSVGHGTVIRPVVLLVNILEVVFVFIRIRILLRVVQNVGEEVLHPLLVDGLDVECSAVGELARGHGQSPVSGRGPAVSLGRLGAASSHLLYRSFVKNQAFDSPILARIRNNGEFFIGICK